MTENHVFILKIVLVVSLFAIVLSLVQARRGKFVVFSSYTDIFMTLAVPLSAAVTAIILHFLGIQSPYIWYVSAFVGSLVLLLVIKSTYAYSAGIISFIFSLYSKLILCFVYVLLLVTILNEGDKGRDGKQRIRTSIIATAGFAFLSLLGLKKRTWVGMGNYLKGTYVADSAE